MNPPKNLLQAIKSLDGMPAIPSIAKKILSLKINTDEGERALHKLIETDPLILSRIIGLANSPLFRTGREILTLHDAAALLGSKRVKMTALSFAMISSMLRKSGGLLNMDVLWKHCVSIAMTMDTLSRFMPSDRRPPDDEIYLGGLLHDIGFLVLEYLDQQLSNEFHARVTAESKRTIIEIEAEMLEINHCELGAELARRWELPDHIVTMLRYHHTPNDERAAGLPLVTLAFLAGRLMPSFDIDEAVQWDIAPEEWMVLGINPAKADEIKTKIEKHVTKVSAISS